MAAEQGQKRSCGKKICRRNWWGNKSGKERVGKIRWKEWEGESGGIGEKKGRKERVGIKKRYISHGKKLKKHVHKI